MTKPPDSSSLSSPSGFLNIDKPAGITSHDVVSRIRGMMRAAGVYKPKVGHAGTLDPLATGVLVICIGQATRLSDYVMHQRKRYRAHVHFGTATDTYDAEGAVVFQADAAHLTAADVSSLLSGFIGTLQQTPPQYSAIKVDGRKLYEYARAGEAVEVKARTVTIESITLLSWQNPIAVLDITCGAGTYIRSIASDMGEQLGVGAHLSQLTRQQSGTFDISSAVTLEKLQDLPITRWPFIEPYDALASYPSVELTPSEITTISYGQLLHRPLHIRSNDTLTVDTGEQEQFVMAYDASHNLVAILKPHDNDDENGDALETDIWKPHKVFVSNP